MASVDPVGELVADLRVTTDKTAGDVKRDLEEIAAVTDTEMTKIGKEAGESFDQEVKKSTKNTGRDLAQGIQTGLEREGLKLTKKVFQLDADGNVVRTWLTTELIKGERAVADLAGTGAFKKIGAAFSDAIGASFNVSGKSPLIALLVPLFGFIAQLVVGVIQLISGLTAVLATLPNAIGAVILQVGVLFLAFQGVGGAIQQAFAAKNVDELNKALENITPNAQAFVRTLVGLREPFKQLRDIAQEAFFEHIAEGVQHVADVLGPVLVANLSGLASALSSVFQGVLSVLGSPLFAQFLSVLIPATSEWIRHFNVAFVDFLVGLTKFGQAIMPFFNWLGQQLNVALAEFGEWLGRLSTDPEFLSWLERMKVALSEGADALMSILGFLKEFANAIDKAGGSESLNDLRTWFDELKKFLATDEGTKAMEGLLRIIQAVAFIFVLLINDLILFLFLFEVTAEFLKQIFSVWLPDALEWIGRTFVGWIEFVGHAIADFFTNQIPEFFNWVGGFIMTWGDGILVWIGGFVIAIVDAIGRAIGAVLTFLLEAVATVAIWIHDRVADIVGFAQSLGGRIKDAVGDLLGLLYDAGRNVITGLINGIKSMFGPLGNVVGQAAQIVRDHWPFSPAKEGPLSGSGDPLIAGQKIVQRIATGIDMASPELSTATTNAASNVLMGAGAVQMNFYGPTPTEAQASSVGDAAGNSLGAALAQRNARLMVRTLGAVS